MTSGLPQVCNLWLGVSKGMLPVGHPPPLILMAVSCCWRPLSRRLEWTSPAYRRKEGTNQHPGVCRHSLLYDWWPDGRFGCGLGGGL